jgi:hypothetical protein
MKMFNERGAEMTVLK